MPPATPCHAGCGQPMRRLARLGEMRRLPCSIPLLAVDRPAPKAFQAAAERKLSHAAAWENGFTSVPVFFGRPYMIVAWANDSLTRTPTGPPCATITAWFIVCDFSGLSCMAATQRARPTCARAGVGRGQSQLEHRAADDARRQARICSCLPIAAQRRVQRATAFGSSAAYG